MLKITKWYGTCTDIDDMKKATDALRELQNKLRIALENANIGIWEWNLKTNEVNLDERSENIFGFAPGTFDGKYTTFESCIHEDDLVYIRESIDKTLKSDVPLEIIYRIKNVSGASNYISARANLKKDELGNPVILSGVNFDITTMREVTENTILKLNEELMRSNKDLQQFAYVASHDLQEPLRMVHSFTQLLAQRYQGKLDQDALDYINFAVDGSKRMFDLLNGLLSYSRVQTKGKEFSTVDMNSVVEKVTSSLSLMIKEKEAIIHTKKLPVIFADEAQMTQVLQNLIENGLKFSKGTPNISISAKFDSDNYTFFVKDKGIGIESQYFDRIFQIFQRLHLREEYSGIGIGLSICKKIIERHGGRIWVESEIGKGTTFVFTISN